VPLQAMLLVFGAAELVLGDLWPTYGLPGVPVWAVFFILAVSMAMPFLALLAEKRKASWKDWLAFLFLMTTWIPVALFATVTLFVRTWHRTPREAEAAPPAGLNATASVLKDDERTVPAKVVR
jgi:hypothetical protein